MTAAATTTTTVEPDLNAAALQAAEQVSFKSIMFGSGPRFARDAFGPLLAFYGVWKLWGLVPGIAASTLVSLWAWRYERKRDRSATMALFTLGFVLVQAAVGIISNSATIYLAQPVLMNAAFGLAFLVSVPMGKPLAGLFANEFYPFPPEVRSSRTFRKVFGNISLVWGFYNIVRSGLRLLILAATSVELFLAVNFVTGVPLMMAAMTWSIWYGVRGFRKSDEWGWAMRGETPPPEVMAAYEAQAAVV
jgi:intracellular septation protein A